MTRAPIDLRYEGSIEASIFAAEIARKHLKECPNAPTGYLSFVVYALKGAPVFQAYYLKNRTVVVRELRPE